MPRNVEIKATIANRWDETQKRAASIADTGPTILDQEDIFYTVPRGRMKLRTVNGRTELIYYLRPDQQGPRESSYIVLPVADAASAKTILAQIHDQRGIVRKRRFLYLAGQTRIHLDRVENLGDFLELEVVLTDAQTTSDGESIAQKLMSHLGIAYTDLVSTAYLDLLASRKKQTRLRLHD